QARARAVGSNSGFTAMDGTSPLPVFAASFDMDFNPTVDRLRVVASSGLNFRMNPNTGALVDGNFGGAVVGGVNPDGMLTTVGTAGVQPARGMGTGYTNNRINVGVTTQYTIDATADTLYIQQPPNAGNLISPALITEGGNRLDIGITAGFDIPPGVDAASPGAVATGMGYAAFTVAGVSGLYSVNLATGAANRIGTFGGLSVIGLSVANLPPSALTLSLDGTRVQRFPLADPAAAVDVGVTGVAGNERLVGIDSRPVSGQLYALGINAQTDTGTLYLLDPQATATTASVTPVGPIGAIRYATPPAVAGDPPIPVDFDELPFGVDFNPVVDRLRVVTAGGLNFRIDPNTGLPVDADNNPVNGITPDADINGPLGVQLGATAYTSNFSGAATTTQYTIDALGSVLYVQSPPNAGVQTAAQPIQIGGQPFVFGGGVGFDVPPGAGSNTANAFTAGVGYFTSETMLGTPEVYALGLTGGAATSLGQIRVAGLAPGSVDSLVAWAAPISVGFTPDPARVGENIGNAVINVTRSGGAPLVVTYRTIDGTATAGSDYTAVEGVLFFAGNDTTRSINIPILADALDEPNETFRIVLAGPFAAGGETTVTILTDAIFRDGFEALAP
ncbi:MAG: DUF4394 domain-containing protein, partial [Burkholderiales bacterium]|nr:DUF4394 domain-containing protein [Burkholderiales bacterium]